MLQRIAKWRSLARASHSFHFPKLRSTVSISLNTGQGSLGKPFIEVPKIPAVPFIGSSWIYAPILGKYDRHDINKAAWQMYHQYGPIVAEKLPGRRIIVHLFSADDFRTLYQEEGRTPYRMGGSTLQVVPRQQAGVLR
ncbi:hypothetical protein MTO96_031785 [Rhipicephalus appendiculatus]